MLDHILLFTMPTFWEAMAKKLRSSGLFCGFWEEEKIKAVMASFADSVIKDQKEQIRAEDEKMMKHIENQLKK